jgi:hypothetical protein
LFIYGGSKVDHGENTSGEIIYARITQQKPFSWFIIGEWGTVTSSSLGTRSPPLAHATKLVVKQAHTVKLNNVIC